MRESLRSIIRNKNVSLYFVLLVVSFLQLRSYRDMDSDCTKI